MPIVPVDPRHPDPVIIAEAAARLRAGGLVAFPTETVYGLGANALDAQAVARIYATKGRPAWNPVIAHVADVAAARALSRAWPESAERLAQAFWPGPLTLVVPKAAHVPDEATAGLDAVGVRVPSHPVALALLRAAGIPVAAPSANRFTQVSPTTASHVVQSLGDRVPLVLDGGPATVGIESTVVDCTGDTVVILRPGMLGRESLEAALEGSGIAVAVAKPSTVAHQAAVPAETPRSPGMADRHYAPRAEVWLFGAEGADEITAALAERRASAATSEPVLALLRTVALPEDAAIVRRMPVDPVGYAQQLYAALHEADARQAALVVIEMPPPHESAWEGVRDRLTRAAR
ncbi:MAG: threonylcarbamoyl-AMP synthase [Gemmatimonadaceae bacterium]|nr:threonylcarbamoyl-AMP synthase [Gemmatimonadaceae bacterium]